MIEIILRYAFLRHAVLAALLASVICGIVGVFIVEKKLVFMSGGIAHASFGGVGLGYLLALEPIWVALVFAVGTALASAALTRAAFASTDTLMGVFWALGMSLGIIFIALAPGYPPDLTSYLFGDILTVTGTDLRFMVIVTVSVGVITALTFNHLKAYLFDAEFLTVLGFPTTAFEYGIFALIAVTVVVLIKVVGIILALALLTIAPATARLYARSLGAEMALAAGLNVLYCWLGLTVSYFLQVPSGAAIILLAAVMYLSTAAVYRTVLG